MAKSGLQVAKGDQEAARDSQKQPRGVTPMKDIVNDERLFFAIQLWKKAGYIGEEPSP